MSPETVALVVLIVGGVFALWHRPAIALGLLFSMHALDQLAAVTLPALQETPWLVNVGIGVAACAAWVRVGATTGRPLGDGSQVVRGMLATFAALFVFSMAGWSGAELDPQTLGISAAYAVVTILVGPSLIRTRSDVTDAIVVAAACTTVVSVLILLNPEWRGQDTRLILALDPSRVDVARTNPLALADTGMTAVLSGLLLSGGGLAGIGLRGVAAGAGTWLATQASRAEPAAGALAVAFVALLARRKLRTRGAILIVVALLTTLSVLILRDTRVASRWEQATLEQSIDIRRELTAGLLQTFIERPEAWPLGLGGNYSLAAPELGMYPHLQVLQALCETGIVGFALWVGAAWITMRRAWRVIEIRDRNSPAVAVLAALAIYQLLLTFKRGNALNPDWFLVAVCIERVYAAGLRVSGKAATPPGPGPIREPSHAGVR